MEDKSQVHQKFPRLTKKNIWGQHILTSEMSKMVTIRGNIEYFSKTKQMKKVMVIKPFSKSGSGKPILTREKIKRKIKYFKVLIINNVFPAAKGTASTTKQSSRCVDEVAVVQWLPYGRAHQMYFQCFTKPRS